MSVTRFALVGFMVLGIPGLILQGTPSPVASPVSGEVVVDTPLGSLEGTAADGVDNFLGVPYAEPPVGDLRWQQPEPVSPWDGLQPASEYGDRCAAAESSNGPRTESEDCLFLNIQRPSDMQADALLPIYVFFHGGGFLNGSSDQADMAEIVQMNDVIGVSVNYRLGVLGFLAHPELTSEAGSSGNYGLMDQQESLRWIQDNISAFGGDPDRVTIGGESAGGISVCAHLVSPGSEGLFSQAMIQSGWCESQPLADAESAGEGVASSLGCDGEDALACLRSADVGDILDVPDYGIVWPVHDTETLPVEMNEAVKAGDAQPVPIVIGSNRDEGRSFTQGMVGMSEEEYQGFVHAVFGDGAGLVLEQYPWPAENDDYTGVNLAGDTFTDPWVCRSLDLTETLSTQSTVYAYEFAHQYGPGLSPELESSNWGAGHAAELAYLFPSFDNGTPIAPTFDADERQLAMEMKLFWGAFVIAGDPQVETLQAWPAYNQDGSFLMIHAGGTSTATNVDDLRLMHNCGFWGEMGDVEIAIP